MQDQNQTNPTPSINPPLLTDDSVVQPGSPDLPDSPDPLVPSEASTMPESAEPSDIMDTPSGSISTMKDVAEKIKSVHNILIALSSDPSVDEIATAIALSLCLDRAGKRATAIYSGTTPNALQFLKPERTFETNSNVLKDFVIALNKEKADHLRYKLDGDYVKIFITPYKTSISESDLEFSLGDFNIELVLALNVPSGIDLDDALREHGRVMHDATVVNLTNGNPGKFGDIEWSDKSKSSIAEMVAELLYDIGGAKAIEPEEATALLTGIVAATDHFTNNMTTANALQMASNLIRSGADRKLITENIGLDSENMFFLGSSQEKESSDGSIKIEHDENEPIAEKTTDGSVTEESEVEPEAEPEAKPEAESDVSSEEAGLLADLQAAADGLKDATEIVKPVATDEANPSDEPKPELKLTPSDSFMAEPAMSSSDYGQMLEEALADSPSMKEPSEPIISTEPPMPAAPIMNTEPPMSTGQSMDVAMPSAPINPVVADTLSIPTNTTVTTTSNPAISAAPVVPSTPEVNGVPEINYTPVPNEEILPPPPAPPIDPSAIMPNGVPPMSDQAPIPTVPTFNS